MSQSNQFPLPQGVKLETGALYGIRKPEFQGDECAVLPFSMVKHSSSPDTLVIKATGERTYEIQHHRPQSTDELGQVEGLLPSMFPSDDDIQEQRQRRGGPMQQSLSSAHHLENDYHEGLRPVPEANNGTGLMANQQSVPPDAELAPSPAPDTGLMAGLGAPPTPAAATTGKAKPGAGKTKPAKT